jgi:hypothetical protein
VGGVRCAVLRESQLLDAAHIIRDPHPEGLRIVVNGIALCAIHHLAYDRNLLGIDPLGVVHISRKLLHEIEMEMALYPVVHTFLPSQSVSAYLPAFGQTPSEKRAKRAIKERIRDDYGLQSSLLFCGRRSKHRIRCDVLFQDSEGDYWCCGASAISYSTGSLKAHLNVDPVGCESF